MAQSLNNYLIVDLPTLRKKNILPHEATGLSSAGQIFLFKGPVGHRQKRSVPIGAPLHLLRLDLGRGGGREAGQGKNENSQVVGTPAISGPPHLGVGAAAKAGADQSLARGRAREEPPPRTAR